MQMDQARNTARRSEETEELRKERRNAEPEGSNEEFYTAATTFKGNNRAKRRMMLKAPGEREKVRRASIRQQESLENREARLGRLTAQQERLADESHEDSEATLQQSSTAREVRRAYEKQQDRDPVITRQGEAQGTTANDSTAYLPA